MQNIPEIRQEQIKMSQYIRRFLDFAKKPSHSFVVEAGTGIGKSFGYLIPVCEYIKSSPEAKVVIGTNTINLQEQLYNKDIPFILHYYPDLTFEKAKGKNNYVCLHKLEESEYNLFSSTEKQEFIHKINTWLQTELGREGDRSHIPFQYNEKLWSVVCAESTACLEEMCPHKRKCYFNKARQRLKKADIIVTNHALVLSDYYIQKVFPEYDILILDEGHNFETNAYSIFTTTINQYDFFKLQAVTNSKTCQGAFRKARALGKIKQFQQDINNAAIDFFLSLEDKRFIEPTNNPYAEQLLAVLQGVMPVLNNTININQVQFVQLELIKLTERILSLIDQLKIWLYQTETGYVYWAENKEIYYCPLNIAAKLRDFWQTKNTVITSATLSVNQSFKIIKQNLGLTENCYSLRLRSPFNYKDNAIVYQPNNAPSPDMDNYNSYLCNTIISVLEKAPGKTFILFTSYKTMQDIYTRVTSKIRGFNWLIQGTGSKESLLTDFRNNPNSVLFGTDTFWEGVDEKINCVIITKLPFEVPTTPIKEAQYNFIKSRGGNPFIDLSLPRCAIKLKQGVGRLIRSSQQQGVLVICDPRIKKPWGKIIINTLPEMPWTNNLDLIDRYLNAG
ncbi:ATP-dependent DNA helicase [Syntrophomonas palmitatica]|uniref:ATP-dependent DNA helicase n=1 Tax=Syntrophomonas palmitatica TaxID=402877 RepID=UPI0006D2A192|nr:ATP-dependent DNA helicase [Syntrophomonas palmitatica]